jgi:hypothetical protein
MGSMGIGVLVSLGALSGCGQGSSTEQGGTLVGLTMTTGYYGCADAGCGVTYDVLLDGAVTVTDLRVGVGLADAKKVVRVDPEELAHLVDGPELRGVVRDGLDCGTVTDVDVRIELRLSQATWSRELAACAYSETDNVVRRTFDLLTTAAR